MRKKLGDPGTCEKFQNYNSHAEILQIIKEWNAELQERTGKFRKHANAVAEWDRRILQNRDILLRLEVFQHLTIMLRRWICLVPGFKCSS